MEIIFANLDDIYRIHNDFYASLQSKLEDLNSNLNSSQLCISRMVITNLTNMLPFYKSFISSQSSGSRFLTQKLETDAEFAKKLDDLTAEVQSPFALSTYLVKPIQRITRYPLLIGKIYESTLPQHPDYTECGHALELAKKFCNEINEVCRFTENYEKLFWLQNHIVFPKKKLDYHVDFNSETKLLGKILLLFGAVSMFIFHPFPPYRPASSHPFRHTHQNIVVQDDRCLPLQRLSHVHTGQQAA